MFEHMTYKNILSNIRDMARADLDKREGSIFFDTIAPFSKEIAKKYLLLDKIRLEAFANTQSGEYLQKRAKESLIERKEGTYAQFLTKFNINIPIGTILKGSKYTYKVIEKVSDLMFIVECQTIGTNGNAFIESLKPTTYIEGFTFANMLSLHVTGTDLEPLEEFRKRYFDTYIDQFFTGSVTEYKELLLSFDEVNKAKAYYDEDENVLTFVLLHKDDLVFKDATLYDIKNCINVPINQKLELQSVKFQKIDIKYVFQYDTGYQNEDIYDDVIEKIDTYFLDLSRTFSDEEEIIVRKSQMEILGLSIKGVKDVISVEINGGSYNITLDTNCIPTKGVVLIE